MPKPPGSRVASARRSEVLRLLRDAPGPMGISDIADRMGVHPNTVRFHLDTLVESGQVERAAAAPRTTGRPPLRYLPVRTMDPTGPRRYDLLGELLLDALATVPDAGARAVEAGRAWGRRQALASTSVQGAHPSGDPVTGLLELLDAADFAPELRRDRGQQQIALGNCPFLELARTGSAIVCSIHLGLMQGALGAWRSPETVERLEPFAEPDRCLAHLATRGAC